MLARSELENLAQIIMMFTPQGLTIIEEERYLRGRAVQLGLEYNDQTSCEDAISEIARVLVAEGLDMVEINPDLEEIIEGQQGESIGSLILKYHNLIWRTAGSQVCTLPRACGECNVVPYIPAILEATQMYMWADVVINGESRTTEIHELKNDIVRCLSDSEGEFIPETWREINVLDFIHSSLSDNCRESGLVSQSIVQVINSRGSDLKWRAAIDSDNQKGEELFASGEGKEYVRTDTDIRSCMK